MMYSRTILSASIVAALAFAGTAWAHTGQPGANQPDQSQNASQDQKKDGNKAGAVTQENAAQLQGITVVGVQASLAKSLERDRNSNAVVSTITAENIGKFPNTDVAEAMTLLPGVTVDRRFGQGGRVSVNGTDPSLNMTYLDGHPIANVNWLFGSPPDRGFNYLILAPGILGSLNVYKTSEARLPSGSLGGTIIMHTRKPLDLPANTLAVSLGGSYNEQAGTVLPQGSVFYSWANESRTFGVDIGASRLEDDINRQGREIFSYTTVSSLMSNPLVADEVQKGLIRPTDKMPGVINSAYFQNPRRRNSFLVNVEWKPSDQWTVQLGGLDVKEDFANINQSMWSQMAGSVTGITSLASDTPGFITSGTVCGRGETMPGVNGAPGTPCPDNQTVFYQGGQRISLMRTKSAHLHVVYSGSRWGLDGQIGTSFASDDSVQYELNATSHGGYSFTSPTGWTFNDRADATDPNRWEILPTSFVEKFPVHGRVSFGHLTGHYDFDTAFTRLLFGVRYSNNRHWAVDKQFVGGTPLGTLADIGGVYITDIMDNQHFPQYTEDMRRHVAVPPDAIERYQRGNPGLLEVPLTAASYLNNTWAFGQKTESVFVQQNFATANGLRGNFGLRYVRNQFTSTGYVLGSSVPTLPADPAWLQTSHRTVNKLLPSFNIVYDTGGAFVLRGAAAKVIAWAPFTQMNNSRYLSGGNPPTGTEGNPELPPYVSYNFSGAVEWYFAPQSVLSFTGFYNHILNYLSIVAVKERAFNSQKQTAPDQYAKVIGKPPGNCTADGFCDYTIQKAGGIGPAQLKGFSLAYQQAFSSGFGIVANYTFADGTTKIGYALPYNSKQVVTLSPYYEGDHFTARVTYNWRSAYQAGGYLAGAPPATISGYTDIGVQLGYNFNEHWQATFSATNLLNEPYNAYDVTPSEPLNRYTNGRLYTAKLRFKL